MRLRCTVVEISRVTCRKSQIFLISLGLLVFGFPVRVTTLEFHQSVWRHKQDPVCVMLRLAILIKRRPTDCHLFVNI